MIGLNLTWGREIAERKKEKIKAKTRYNDLMEMKVRSPNKLELIKTKLDTSNNYSKYNNLLEVHNRKNTKEFKSIFYEYVQHFA